MFCDYFLQLICFIKNIFNSQDNFAQEQCFNRVSGHHVGQCNQTVVSFQ